MMVISRDWGKNVPELLNFVKLFRLVWDETLHLSHTPPSFGTPGNLILDIAIAYYSTTLLLYSFSLFYSTGKTMEKYKPGGIYHPAPNNR